MGVVKIEDRKRINKTFLRNWINGIYLIIRDDIEIYCASFLIGFLAGYVFVHYL